jgi:hypothetical protein
MDKIQCCFERKLCKLCSAIKIPLTSLSFIVNNVNAITYTSGVHMSKWADLPGGISVIHRKQWLLSSRSDIFASSVAFSPMQIRKSQTALLPLVEEYILGILK